jgi:hypothetical protein
MTPSTLQKLGQLAEPLKSRIAALLARTGDAVWIVSGFRSNQEQIALRRAHCGTTFYDIYQRPSSQCSPPTAIPGRSQHEKGLAVDLGGNLALAAKEGTALGLDRPVKGEAWHFQVGDDAAGAQLLAGGGLGDTIGDVLGGLPFGVLGGQVDDAIGSALGGLVEPFLAGGRRIALTGLLVAGGVTLVVLGGIRGTHTKEIPTP